MKFHNILEVSGDPGVGFQFRSGCGNLICVCVLVQVHHGPDPACLCI